MLRKKLLALVAVLSCLAVGSVNAGTRTFYFKASATASPEEGGLVYVSFSADAPDDSMYVAKDSTEVFAKSASQLWGNPSNTTATLYLYAKPMAGYKFLGWATSADATSYVSTEMQFKPSVRSTKYSAEDDAESFEYYAFFELATEFYSSRVDAKSVGDGLGLVSVSLPGDSVIFDSVMSAQILNDMYSEHTYILQAKAADSDSRFVAWYRDEACDTLISRNASYTYKVTAASLDSLNPTLFMAYAQFEQIPYYYSSVTAMAYGDGKVSVSATSNGQGEYEQTSELDRKVADSNSHTYYLNAQANDVDRVEFDGWYADENLTDLLSTQSSYTLRVDSASMDSVAPAIRNIYAKFSARNMYQVRNAGFERWNARNNEPSPGWNSFPSAVGSLASTAQGMSPQPARVEGRNGGYAVRLISKFAGLFGIGANANGNLTTGIVNMGSMTPSDSTNCNFTDTEKYGHYLIIDGQPDAVEFYTKYRMGDGAPHTGHAQFFLHDKYNYRDPESSSEIEHRIASASINIEESSDWMLTRGDFVYDWSADSAANTVKYLLINFTTNITPGGSKGDTLVIDDVRLIYNSELSAVKFADAQIMFCDTCTTMIDSDYDESAIALESNGRGASVESDYDVQSGIMSVVVKGNDFSADSTNCHRYEFQFKKYTATFVMPDSTFTVELPAGASIEYPSFDEVDGYDFLGWDNSYEVMPSNDIICTAVMVATGIDGIEDESSEEKYDLNGRRINGTGKGVQIINGRKVFVK